MNFKKFVLKMVLVIISMRIKLEDFGLDDILIDEKLHGNALMKFIAFYMQL